MDERLERVYARWCARSVLHLWDAPEVVRRWVDEGEEGLRAAARTAAMAVATEAMNAKLAAWSAASDALRAEARDAELYAARAVESRAEALQAESRRARPRVSAWFAEGVKQSRTIDLLGIFPGVVRAHGGLGFPPGSARDSTALPDLLRAHGLAARLLDDVREDPWLTREVVRALELPDLAVWCDWYKNVDVEVWQ